jgi:hypothetical protein
MSRRNNQYSLSSSVVLLCYFILFNLYAYYRVVFCVQVSVEYFDGNHTRTYRVLIFLYHILRSLRDRLS